MHNRRSSENERERYVHNKTNHIWLQNYWSVKCLFLSCFLLLLLLLKLIRSFQIRLSCLHAIHCLFHIKFIHIYLLFGILLPICVRWAFRLVLCGSRWLSFKIATAEKREKRLLLSFFFVVFRSFSDRKYWHFNVATSFHLRYNEEEEEGKSAKTHTTNSI